MQLKLNAEIILTIPEKTELTEEESGGVILGIKQALNKVGAITLPTLSNLLVGVRIHITSEMTKDELSEAEYEDENKCVWCDNATTIRRSLSKCKMCYSRFCNHCMHEHIHCKVCLGTGVYDVTKGKGTMCLTCEGTGLEK